MWLLRSIARLAVNSVAAFAVALAVALVQAPFRRDHFVDGLVVSCYAVGALLVLMGALGGASLGRAADAQARKAALGRLPGLPGWAQRRETEPAETPTAAFLVAGFALFATAIFLS